MIIVILGASGSGKSTLENSIYKSGKFDKIISYTTRDRRDKEINGADYHFINVGTFNDMKESGLFAEWDEYSEQRFYGTVMTDYVDGVNKVCVLTPNGLRQLRKNVPNANIFSVYVECPLGTRIKRYIDRVGEDKFNYSDKNEICARVERDFGAFLKLGEIEEIDFVFENTNMTDMNDVAEKIIFEAERKFICE